MPEFLVQPINDFTILEKLTIVDNASTHRSKLFRVLEMGRKRFVYLFPAQVFTAFEHCGNISRKAKYEMACIHRRHFFFFR